tara:strand:+ start:328 stop:564 length:237 start_codon:yes stop_codon:yes gene_type:complete
MDLKDAINPEIVNLIIVNMLGKEIFADLLDNQELKDKVVLIKLIVNQIYVTIKNVIKMVIIKIVLVMQVVKVTIVVKK